MELEMNLLDEEDEEDLQEISTKVFTKITEESLIPKDKIFLGLDIAELSTGICIYENGKRFTANITLNYAENSPHREVLLRRELKSDLSQVIQGKIFDAIIIEDAYQGINPSTTRLLYALNSAIDEMILDNEITCKEFIRIPNSTWKSWLYILDSNNDFKGLNDKLKIEKCLRLIGIEEFGEGYQDRLDATGMIIGYLLCKDRVDKVIARKKKVRVSISDVGLAYVEDMGMLVYEIDDDIEKREFLKNTEKISKKKIISYLTDKPDTVFISSIPVKLGRLASELNMPYIEGGGYFAFWVKSKRFKKYLANLEV